MAAAFFSSWIFWRFLDFKCNPKSRISESCESCGPSKPRPDLIPWGTLFGREPRGDGWGAGAGGALFFARVAGAGLGCAGRVSDRFLPAKAGVAGWRRRGQNGGAQWALGLRQRGRAGRWLLAGAAGQRRATASAGRERFGAALILSISEKSSFFTWAEARGVFRPLFFVGSELIFPKPRLNGRTARRVMMPWLWKWQTG